MITLDDIDVVAPQRVLISKNLPPVKKYPVYVYKEIKRNQGIINLLQEPEEYSIDKWTMPLSRSVTLNIRIMIFFK